MRHCSTTVCVLLGCTVLTAPSYTAHKAVGLRSTEPQTHFVWSLNDGDVPRRCVMIREVSDGTWGLVGVRSFHPKGVRATESNYEDIYFPDHLMRYIDDPELVSVGRREWDEAGTLRAYRATSGNGPLHGLVLSWDARGNYTRDDSGVYEHGEFVYAPREVDFDLLELE